MKKFLSVVSALCLLLSLFALTAFADESAMSLRLETEESDGLLYAELVCEGSPGLMSVQFTLSYNSAVLKCTDCEMGEALRPMMGAENPDGAKGAVIAAASTKAVNTDGVLARFSFDILGEGDYGFGLADIHFALADGSEAAYSFTVAGEELQPPADPLPEEPPFTDLEGHWAEAYLMKGHERGILQGYPDGSCKPDANVTRAQFVTFLWRSMGEPEPSAPSDFTDLNPRAEYYLDAVAWAQEMGYIIGVGDNKFLPDDSISRQEVATILHRAAGGMPGGELMFGSIYDNYFTDSADTPAWAKGAVYWAVYNEVWCGKGSVETGKVLASRAEASRAEIVVMMVNYQDKFER